MRKIIQVFTIYPGDADNFPELGALDDDGNIYIRLVKPGETWKLLNSSQEVIEEASKARSEYL